MISVPAQAAITRQVELALHEDIGSGDVSASLIAADRMLSARIITREDAILCGQHWVNAVFTALNNQVQITWHKHDSESLQAGETICELHGPARNILTGERTALNFLQLLSGTATLVRSYVDLIADLPVRLLDTRKTIPGLRIAQKYAVTCGSGHNHRIGLFDAIMLKENHLAAGNSGHTTIQELVKKARDLHPAIPVIVEVEDLQQLEQAVLANADRALLDNFDMAQLQIAVEDYADSIRLEASGGITKTNLRSIAETGVHDISIGALTKQVEPVDLSMQWQ